MNRDIVLKGIFYITVSLGLMVFIPALLGLLYYFNEPTEFGIRFLGFTLVAITILCLCIFGFGVLTGIKGLESEKENDHQT